MKSKQLSKLEKLKQAKIKEFTENVDNIVSKQLYAMPTYGWAISILHQLEDIRYIVDNVVNISYKFSYQTELSYSYKTEDGYVIAINPNNNMSTILFLLAKEYRNVWHLYTGMMVNPAAYKPKQAIIINRIQNIDPLTFAIKCAWELSLLGNQLLVSHVYAHYQSYTHLFISEASGDFRKIRKGLAARLTAEIISNNIPKLKLIDHEIIGRMLNANLLLECNNSMDIKKYVENYCNIPNVDTYFMDYSEDYLCVIEDRNLANHLWFIEFELSFNARENALKDSNTLTNTPNPDNILQFRRKNNEE